VAFRLILVTGDPAILIVHLRLLSVRIITSLGVFALSRPWFRSIVLSCVLKSFFSGCLLLLGLWW